MQYPTQMTFQDYTMHCFCFCFFNGTNIAIKCLDASLKN